MSFRRILGVAQGVFDLVDSVKGFGSWAASTFRKVRRGHRESKSKKIIISGNERGMRNILRHLRKKRRERQSES